MYTRGLPLTRQLKPGVDLPSWFVEQMYGLDDKFHFVFHKWRLIWDDIMNYHTGEEENPRFCIGEQYGEECWGWPLTDGDGNPIREDRWHVWRRVNDVGWYHVIDIVSHTGPHLKKILEVLGREALLRDKGRRAYVDARREKDEEELEKREGLAKDKWEFISKENKGLMRNVHEHFERGQIEATNPTKDQIISYPGQKRRSRIILPMDDKDAGLVTWEDV